MSGEKRPAAAEGSMHEAPGEMPLPEVSVEGLRAALIMLADTSVAADENREVAASNAHPDITSGAVKDFIKNKTALDRAILVLDLVLPKPNTSWKEDVERLKAPKIEQIKIVEERRE